MSRGIEADFANRQRSGSCRFGTGERLWPDLKRAATGQWAPNASKTFTRGRKRYGLYEPGRDFHSFRHGVVTGLMNADVPLERVQAIVGHKGDRPNVTIGIYMKKVDIKLLKKDIEKLNYDGLDLSGLMR